MFFAMQIRIACELPDMMGFTMSVPDVREWPNVGPLMGRILVVKGPSLAFSHRHNKLHHRKNKVNCEKTKEVHEKEEANIKKNPAREVEYHFIVFPPEVILDNSILSSNNFDVKASQNGVKMEAQDPEVDNTLKRDLNFMSVWWQIAEAGGVLAASSLAKAPMDLAALLD